MIINLSKDNFFVLMAEIFIKSMPEVLVNTQDIIIMFLLSILRIFFWNLGNLYNDKLLWQLSINIGKDYYIFLKKIETYSIIKQYYWGLPYNFSNVNNSGVVSLKYNSVVTEQVIYFTELLTLGLVSSAMIIILWCIISSKNLKYYLKFVFLNFFLLTFYTELVILVQLLETNSIYIYNYLFLLYLLFLTIWISTILLLMFIYFNSIDYKDKILIEYSNHVFIINTIFIILCIINFYFLFNPLILIITVFIIVLKIFFFFKQIYI